MIFASMNPTTIAALAGFSFDFKGSTLLLILLILLGIIWSVIAYRQTVPPTKLPLRIILGSLRAFAFLLLILLIFEPSLSWRRSQHLKPLVAVLFDDSQSMKMEDAAGSRREALERLMGNPAWDELEEKFELSLFSAGDSLHQLKELSLDSLRQNTIGTDLASDWAKVLKSQDTDTFGAIILVSDGGDNAGKNPLQAARDITVPIYTVGIGDTATVQDASLASIGAGEVAYKGKETQVRAHIRAHGMEGQEATLELVGPEGRLLSRETLRLPPEDLETEAVLKFTPQVTGTIGLTLHLKSSSRERSDQNNLRSFPLEVRESRIRVLVVGSAAGFESLFFLRAANAIPEVEIQSLTFRADGNLYGRGMDQLSRELARSDVLVMVGLPVQGNAAARERLRHALVEHPLPTWIWTGNEMRLEDLINLAGEVPFSLVSQRAGDSAPAVPLRYYAELDPDAESSESAQWDDMPPLDPPKFRAQAKSGAQTLIGFKGNSTGADLGPAMLAWEAEGKRFMVSFGTGYWKWSFLSGGLEGSDNFYRNYLGRVLRWLAASPRQQPLKLKPDRQLYSAGEAVRLGAQVLGGEGRFITSAQVEAVLQGPDGTSRIILEPEPSGQYRGTFLPEAVGSYHYQGFALVEGDTFGTDSGSFLVEAYNVEKETLSQNRTLLEGIANATGGSYLPADSIATLSSLITAPPRVASVGWSRRFFLNWDVWGLLVGLLSLEWFIRKRKGML